MKKGKLFIFFFSISLFIIGLSSCEKSPIDENEVTLTLRIEKFKLKPFDINTQQTKAEPVGIDKVCTCINVALFKGDEKIKTLHQKSKDANFGNIEINLQKGHYTLVVIAHSGQGNASISSPEKITFYKGKLTDTFYYYGEINVESDEMKTIELTRAVAMFRLITNDNIPQEVKQMQFKYTGGSSTLNAKTGMGSVKSRQTENISINSNEVGKTGTFDVYTFPRNDSKEIHVKITALDINDKPLAERTFKAIPIERNKITELTGSFFTGDIGSISRKISFTAYPEWTTMHYKF